MVIRNVLFLSLPSDKVERHLVTQALVREVHQALNTWAYSAGAYGPSHSRKWCELEDIATGKCVWFDNDSNPTHRPRDAAQIEALFVAFAAQPAHQHRHQPRVCPTGPRA